MVVVGLYWNQRRSVAGIKVLSGSYLDKPFFLVATTTVACSPLYGVHARCYGEHGKKQVASTRPTFVQLTTILHRPLTPFQCFTFLHTSVHKTWLRALASDVYADLTAVLKTSSKFSGRGELNFLSWIESRENRRACYCHVYNIR